MPLDIMYNYLYTIWKTFRTASNLPPSQRPAGDQWLPDTEPPSRKKTPKTQQQDDFRDRLLTIKERNEDALAVASVQPSHQIVNQASSEKDAIDMHMLAFGKKIWKLNPEEQDSCLFQIHSVINNFMEQKHHSESYRASGYYPVTHQRSTLTATISVPPESASVPPPGDENMRSLHFYNQF